MRRLSMRSDRLVNPAGSPRAALSVLGRGAYTPTHMPICGSCGRDNPEPARFCMSCASPLTAVPALGMARKTVSIVFCDVVGSTPMGTSSTPRRFGG